MLRLPGYEQGEDDLSLEEKIELITELMKYQKDLAQIKKYQAQQSKLATKSERRKFYMLVLRSNAGWKTKDFKEMTFEQIEENERLKRPGILLVKERAKRLKTTKDSGTELQIQEAEATKEKKSDDQDKIINLQQWTVLVREETSVEVTPPAIKEPICDLKIYRDKLKEVYQIFRVGQAPKAYPYFATMLKEFDRDDIVTPWKLVKDRFKTELPKSDLEKCLFWPLKVMFEPVATDGLWQFQEPIKINDETAPGDNPDNRHNHKHGRSTACYFHHPTPNGARDEYHRAATPTPLKQGSRNYETLVALMQEETKKRSSQSLQARLNFGPEDEVSPPRHQKERRGKDNRRPPVFGRIGKQVSGTQTANLQNLDTHENTDRRISVRDRLGSRNVHSRLGQRRSPSESPPSSDSEDSRRKRRRRISSSSEDTSDNEDAETGHWKSKNKYRGDEDEDMSRPWRRQKVDAFTRRISDFSEDKKRRMPANVKTYDGTGDPDDHLKIFESAATIENWPQPVWCHMLRRAFRLNFTQRKKCSKNHVELARVKQRQGESTSAYVERYKNECIQTCNSAAQSKDGVVRL
ncbi:hypothetical protein Tco_1284191 [Tanacetum coccineum]